MACIVQPSTINELLNLMGGNPNFAAALQANPGAVASQFGITLSPTQASAISANLDLSQVSAWANQVNTYAAKAASGIGI